MIAVLFIWVSQLPMTNQVWILYDKIFLVLAEILDIRDVGIHLPWSFCVACHHFHGHCLCLMSVELGKYIEKKFASIASVVNKASNA